LGIIVVVVIKLAWYLISMDLRGLGNNVIVIQCSLNSYVCSHGKWM